MQTEGYTSVGWAVDLKNWWVAFASTWPGHHTRVWVYGFKRKWERSRGRERAVQPTKNVAQIRQSRQYCEEVDRAQPGKQCKYKTVKAVGGLQLQMNVLTISKFSQKDSVRKTHNLVRRTQDWASKTQDWDRKKTIQSKELRIEPASLRIQLQNTHNSVKRTQEWANRPTIQSERRTVQSDGLRIEPAGLRIRPTKMHDSVRRTQDWASRTQDSVRKTQYAVRGTQEWARKTLNSDRKAHNAVRGTQDWAKKSQDSVSQTHNQDTKKSGFSPKRSAFCQKDRVLRKKDSGFSHKDSGCTQKVIRQLNGLSAWKTDGPPSPRLDWDTTLGFKFTNAREIERGREKEIALSSQQNNVAQIRQFRQYWE